MYDIPYRPARKQIRSVRITSCDPGADLCDVDGAEGIASPLAGPRNRWRILSCTMHEPQLSNRSRRLLFKDVRNLNLGGLPHFWFEGN